MRKSLTVWALLLTLSVGGCAMLMDAMNVEPKGSQTNPSAFCLIARPITWSAKDTDATIEQVKEHNAVGKRLCGWGVK